MKRIREEKKIKKKEKREKDWKTKKNQNFKSVGFPFVDLIEELLHHYHPLD